MKLRKLPSCGASGVAYRVRRGKAQAPGKAILQHASACKKRAQLIQLAYKEAREEAPPASHAARDPEGQAAFVLPAV